MPDLTVCWELGGDAKKIPTYDEDEDFDYIPRNGTNFDNYDSSFNQKKSNYILLYNFYIFSKSVLCKSNYIQKCNLWEIQYYD